MDQFTKAYKHFGLNRGEHEGKAGLWYREWAPGAQAIALIGEFNNWSPEEGHWAKRDDFGNFNLFLPDINGKPQVPHRCACLHSRRFVFAPAALPALRLPGRQTAAVQDDASPPRASAAASLSADVPHVLTGARSSRACSSRAASGPRRSPRGSSGRRRSGTRSSSTASTMSRRQTRRRACLTRRSATCTGTRAPHGHAASASTSATSA
jgi:Carbohydrate-binding module 48 (Isoamylase N-terminal domain)